MAASLFLLLILHLLSLTVYLTSAITDVATINTNCPLERQRFIGPNCNGLFDINHVPVSFLIVKSLQRGPNWKKKITVIIIKMAIFSTPAGAVCRFGSVGFPLESRLFLFFLMIIDSHVLFTTRDSLLINSYFIVLRGRDGFLSRSRRKPWENYGGRTKIKFVIFSKSFNIKK